jgi:hypothetical protein
MNSGWSSTPERRAEQARWRLASKPGRSNANRLKRLQAKAEAEAKQQKFIDRQLRKGLSLSAVKAAFDEYFPIST